MRPIISTKRLFVNPFDKLRVDTEEIGVSVLKMVRKIVYVGVVLIGTYLIINLGSTIANLWQKQEELVLAQKELETLKKENKDLIAQLEYTRSPEFLEREAREKLGLVLPGEKQVIIEEGLLKATEGAKPQPQNWWINWEKWWGMFVY